MATITLTITGDEQPDTVSLRTLTREDTGDAVAGVTLPDDFTGEGSGVWSYTFTAPADGLHYDYTYRLNWSDGGFNDAAGGLDDTSTATVAGTYWSWVGIKNILGKDNATISSQLDNNVTTADMARVAYNGTIADAETNRRARIAGYATPISEDAEDFILVQQATDLYAAWMLVMHREWFENVGRLTDEQRAGLEKRYLDAYRRLFGEDEIGTDAPSTTSPSGLAAFLALTPARGKLNYDPCCPPNCVN